MIWTNFIRLRTLWFFHNQSMWCRLENPQLHISICEVWQDQEILPHVKQTLICCGGIHRQCFWTLWSAVSVYASHDEGCGLSPRPGHTKNYLLFVWVLRRLETSEVISWRYLQWYFDQCAATQKCHAADTGYDTPPRHSIQRRRRPVAVLSIDVKRHTGIHSYPF